VGVDPHAANPPFPSTIAVPEHCTSPSLTLPSPDVMLDCKLCMVPVIPLWLGLPSTGIIGIAMFRAGLRDAPLG
jgi:hypothetical protein